MVQLVTPSTELQAVNDILKNLGEVPVNTLTGTIPLEASQALDTLNEISREIQKRGWYFNTEDHSMSPDVSGFIYLPANTLQCRAIAGSRGTKVTKRGDRLYNMTPFYHSFVWTFAMQLQIVIGLPFEELPQTARSYITQRAARVFQIRQLGDEMNARDDTGDEAKALTDLIQEQARMSPYSLRDSASVSRTLQNTPYAY